jgi:hypothetical protein
LLGAVVFLLTPGKLWYRLRCRGIEGTMSNEFGNGGKVMTHPDDKRAEESGFQSMAEADRSNAGYAGSLYPERPWVLSDRDVWYRNPFYKGPPVPHPEDGPENY